LTQWEDATIGVEMAHIGHVIYVNGAQHAGLERKAVQGWEPPMVLAIDVNLLVEVVRAKGKAARGLFTLKEDAASMVLYSRLLSSTFGQACTRAAKMKKTLTATTFMVMSFKWFGKDNYEPTVV
jgi:hypothetical protein